MFSPRRVNNHSNNRKYRDRRSFERTYLRERAKSRRAISPAYADQSFVPPENWYEPTGAPGYRVLIQEPGPEYRHVVTEDQVRTRLSKLPPEFLEGLEVVQLSRMTRKKAYCPCYGMQWGCAIYLYPFDETFDEFFYVPPPRAFVIESKMYGGRWEQPEVGVWRLIWSESSARDFQLNNVLIHELGHLIDDRNSSYIDQERFAEWFAIEYGYRHTGGIDRRRPKRRIRRRHHGT